MVGGIQSCTSTWVESSSDEKREGSKSDSAHLHLHKPYSLDPRFPFITAKRSYGQVVSLTISNHRGRRVGFSAQVRVKERLLE